MGRLGNRIAWTIALATALLIGWTGSYLSRPSGPVAARPAAAATPPAMAAQITEIRRELEAANGTRLELVLAGMGLIFTAFGITSTILLVVIAIRVDRRAVGVAERAMADHKVKLDERIGRYESMINGIATRMSAAEPLTRTDAAKLDAAVRDARTKSPMDHTPADLLALIAVSSEQDRWRDIIEFSTILRMRTQDNPAMECASYYHEAVAWTCMERFEEALTAFSLVLSKFTDASQPGIRIQHAKSAVNYGIILIKMRRFADSLAYFDDLVAKTYDAADIDQVQRHARARIMHAYALDELGRVQDAIDALDRVIASLGHHSDARIVGRIATAYYNKACGLAKLDKPQLAVNALQAARDRGFLMSRESLLTDQDLSRIHASPAFKVLLTAFK